MGCICEGGKCGVKEGGIDAASTKEMALQLLAKKKGVPMEEFHMVRHLERFQSRTSDSPEGGGGGGKWPRLNAMPTEPHGITEVKGNVYSRGNRKT